MKLARNNIDGRLYVLKCIKAYDLNIYENLKEIHAPGLTEIYELLPTEKGIYVVEEYVETVSFEEYIGRSEDTLTDILLQLCDTLTLLHSMQPPIIHRDIKPDNILIDREGRVKLIDFHISRHYTGSADKDTFAMGTSRFAAPEQYGFLESDPRTDIYGLGATIEYLMKECDIKSEVLSDFVERAKAFSPKDRFEDTVQIKYFIKHYVEIKKYNEKKLKEAEQRKSLRRFLPPGYRTGTPYKVIISTFVYFIWIVNTWGTLVAYERFGTRSKGQYFLAIGLYWAWLLTVVGFSFNYLDIHKKFRIDKLKGVKKVLAIIGMDIILILIVLMIGVFLVKKV